MKIIDRYADWIGREERRFRWLKLRFEWGRWHYNTNCCGETTRIWWEWSDEND